MIIKIPACSYRPPPPYHRPPPSQPPQRISVGRSFYLSRSTCLGLFCLSFQCILFPRYCLFVLGWSVCVCICLFDSTLFSLIFLVSWLGCVFLLPPRGLLCALISFYTCLGMCVCLACLFVLLSECPDFFKYVIFF